MIALLLAACFGRPDAPPPGTLTFPIEVGHPSVIEWMAPGAGQELWVDVETTNGRALTGSVVVTASGAEVARGDFGLGHSLASRYEVRAQNWVTTPGFARGQMYLVDVDGVAPGTPMRATFDLRAGEGTTVSKLVLQVRPE